MYLAWDVGALCVVLPELTAHIEDQADGAELLWERLRAVDQMQADGRLPSDTVMIAALLQGPLQEAMAGVRDPLAAFDEFFGEMVGRLSLPRRMRDRMRLVFAAQRRLERGQIAPLRKRDLWQDAAALFEVQCRAEGRKLPDWLHEKRGRSRDD